MIFVVRVRKSLVDQVFGKLTVLKQVEDYVRPDGRHESMWLCQCDCGSEPFEVIGYNLKTGNTWRCSDCGRKSISEFNHEVNDYDLSGEYGIGWTHNTGREFYFDLEDYDKIKDYCWSEAINVCGYHSLEARDYKGNGKLMRFHYLLGFKGYDHEDRNALNNRKSNLRKATAQENARNTSRGKNNTSGFIGVSWYKPGNKWRAYIDIGDNFKSLGYYFDKNDAVIARLKAEKQYFGEFAPQRHLFEEYGI